jgi:hypothetical protein
MVTVLSSCDALLSFHKDNERLNDTYRNMSLVCLHAEYILRGKMSIDEANGLRASRRLKFEMVEDQYCPLDKWGNPSYH